ncbi:ABC transporter substrate-binding protein [Arthrobacter sp. NPDC058130]|uniref:ABC transporter substrate-binding protein n=1 Tax=Arthrobacter sp. NPDC058130 TaxID=3346353 RepID=UPI0036DFB898
MKLTRKTGRLAAVIGTVAAAALVLSGCGSTGPSASGGASAWALTGQQKTIQSAFDSWNQSNADQSINVQFFQNDAFKQKIRTAIGSGNSPTLIWSWGGAGNFKTYVDSKKVIPLDESLTKNFFPSIVNNGKIDGTLYAIPNNTVQPVVLYFNKDLFKKAGIDTPPATWDELLHDVSTLKANGIAPFAMGGASKWPQLMWLEYLLDRIGGPKVFEAIQQNKKDAWSDPAIAQSIDKIQELIKAGGFIDGYHSVSTDSNADTALLTTGKAAMIVQGAWAYANMKNSDPEFVKSSLGWSPFPTVGGGAGDPKNVVGNASNYWSISSDASQTEQTAAKQFLAKGNMTDAYVDNLIAGGGVPPVLGIESKIKASPNGDFLMDVYTMSKDAPSFTLSWDQAISPAAADAMLTNLDKVFLGQMNAQQFADAMNKTIQ